MRAVRGSVAAQLPQKLPRSSHRGRSGRRRAVGPRELGQMVVLDQNAIVETMPMVGATPAANGVFLEHPKAGSGLAGIEDGDAAAGGVDEFRCQRGDAAQPLEKIKRGPFGLEQGMRVAVHYNTSREEAEKVAREIGNGSMAFGAELGDPDAPRRLVADVVREFDRIDVLVNSASNLTGTK